MCLQEFPNKHPQRIAKQPDTLCQLSQRPIKGTPQRIRTERKRLALYLIQSIPHSYKDRTQLLKPFVRPLDLELVPHSTPA